MDIENEDWQAVYPHLPQKIGEMVLVTRTEEGLVVEPYDNLEVNDEVFAKLMLAEARLENPPGCFFFIGLSIVACWGLWKYGHLNSSHWLIYLGVLFLLFKIYDFYLSFWTTRLFKTEVVELLHELMIILHISEEELMVRLSRNPNLSTLAKEFREYLARNKHL